MKTIKITELAGKNIAGIMGQVRNRKYIDSDYPEMWRTLRIVKTFTEGGKKWVQIYWEKEPLDSCDFSGCTVESNSTQVEFTDEQYEKLKTQNASI